MMVELHKMSKEDQLHDIRCHVPEPTWVPEHPLWEFLWPMPAPCFWDDRLDDYFDFHKTGLLRKIRVHEPGLSYTAWSFDGTTPLFPVPVSCRPE